MWQPVHQTGDLLRLNLTSHFEFITALLRLDYGG